MNAPQQIYEFICQRRRPCALPGAWQRFPCPEGFSAGNEDCATLLQELTEKFSSEELRNAGVMVSGAKGEWVLHPSLANPTGVIFSLRTSQNDLPFDLLVEGGCISGQHLPVCAVLKDYRCIQLLETSQDQVVVAFSIEATMVLWAMGIAAATSSGMESLSATEIQAFRKAYALTQTRPSFHSPTESDDLADSDNQTLPPGLVFANWNPANLELVNPPGLVTVKRHLGDLNRHLDMALDDIEIWKPSEQHVEQLRFCLSRGSRQDVRRALLASLAEQREWLIERPKDRPKPSPMYAAAAAEWTAASIGDELSGSFEQAAWKTLLQIYEQDVISPLLKQAQEMADPVSRTLVVTAANLSRVVHSQSLLLTKKFRKEVHRNAPSADASEPTKDLKNLIATVDRLLAVIGNLQCPARTSTRQFGKRSQSRKRTRSLNNSTSPTRKGPA